MEEQTVKRPIWKALLGGIGTSIALLLFMRMVFLSNFYDAIAPLLGTTAYAFLQKFFLMGVFLLIFFTGVLVYMLLARSARGEHLAARKTRSLAVSREEFRRLYDDGPVPHIMLDKRGRIQRPNKAAIRLFGMTFEELNETTLLDYIVEEDRQHASLLIARFKNKIPFEGEEVRITLSSGSVRWLSLSIFSFRDPLTHTRSGLVTLVDITEQKELDQAKTEFVSLASHQLRTPLSTTKWYTEMLASGDLGVLNEQQHEYVTKVQSANETMIDLVETLLNVSRLEMGTFQLDLVSVSVGDMVESVLEELQPQITHKRLHVQKTIDASCGYIQSDKRLFRIILQNILSNAVKYTPEDGAVTLQATCQNGVLNLQVQDTGYGIPPEEQDKIFQKMYRAHNVREKSVDGNGLGLYLVKSIVELLGGTIGFESTLDVGTTFTITHPMR